jgi:hypothetical protein
VGACGCVWVTAGVGVAGGVLRVFGAGRVTTVGFRGRVGSPSTTERVITVPSHRSAASRVLPRCQTRSRARQCPRTKSAPASSRSNAFPHPHPPSAARKSWFGSARSRGNAPQASNGPLGLPGAKVRKTVFENENVCVAAGGSTAQKQPEASHTVVQHPYRTPCKPTTPSAPASPSGNWTVSNPCWTVSRHGPIWQNPRQN